MKHPLHHFRVRPRLLGSMLAGAVITLLLPGSLSWVTRCLIGWNVAAWSYLALIGLMMVRSDHARLRRIAQAQHEDAVTVLGLVVAAAIASMIGIVVELAAAKLPGAPHALPHMLFALTTVAGAWTLLPTLFTLTYASVYYRSPQGSGLRFPGADADFHPGYGDFLYFAFTIAVASQTADVAVDNPAMRRLVLLHSVLSFAFNTAILAFTVNIAASMF
jgi:uncharacterized membrane protein